MRSVYKDILTALLLGLVLPGSLLNAAVAFLDQGDPHQEQEPTEQTLPTGTALPMYLRLSDGGVEQRDMDSYLVGVVLAEMPASFEPEALKAQAVAARTYTQKAVTTGGKHGDGSVCTDSGCCQAYITQEAYLSQGGTQEGIRKIVDAVAQTSGYVLTYEGELIEATYFSCSGGRTEDAAAVWGAEFPYLQAVDSPGEEDAAYYTDTVSFTPEAFQQALGVTLSGEPDTWLQNIVYTEGGGVASVEIGDEIYQGTQLRTLLGLRSTAFTVTAAPGEIVFTTRGYGHRVGMSQYGADAMAVAGSTYQQILAHYYPGTELTWLG